MAGIEAPATGESRRERLPPLPPTATAPVVDSTNLCDDDGFGGARGVDAGRVPVR